MSIIVQEGIEERGKEYEWEKQGRRTGGRAGKRPQQRKNRGGVQPF